LRATFWQIFQSVMERQLSRTCHARLGLAIAGVCALTLHLWVPWGSGPAFVPSASNGVAPLQRQTAARPARFAETFSDQGGRATWTLGAAGGLFLLCSMATRQRRFVPGRKAQHGTRRWQVMTCHAFGPATTCSFPESRQTQSVSHNGPRMPSTIAATPCTVSLNVTRAVQTPDVMVEPFATMEGEATVTIHSRVHALPAFCVNGVRRPRGHKANRRSSRTASAGRTARRSVGARLQPVPEVTSSCALAYDPSRMRTKIQNGLRASRQPGNSAHHRECKTPVNCNCMMDQSGELYETHHTSALLRTCSDDLERLCCSRCILVGTVD